MYNADHSFFSFSRSFLIHSSVYVEKNFLANTSSSYFDRFNLIGFESSKEIVMGVYMLISRLLTPVLMSTGIDVLELISVIRSS